MLVIIGEQYRRLHFAGVPTRVAARTLKVTSCVFAVTENVCNQSSRKKETAFYLSHVSSVMPTVIETDKGGVKNAPEFFLPTVHIS
jgi:hypothetical protein